MKRIEFFEAVGHWLLITITAVERCVMLPSAIHAQSRSGILGKSLRMTLITG
jgi:hypothetical protein